MWFLDGQAERKVYREQYTLYACCPTGIITVSDLIETNDIFPVRKPDWTVRSRLGYCFQGNRMDRGNDCRVCFSVKGVEGKSAVAGIAVRCELVCEIAAIVFMNRSVPY